MLAEPILPDSLQIPADRTPGERDRRMSKLLFLSHRIPFPPDKGDKIRSFHMLRHLASRHEIHLGAFVDDPDDWRHQDALRAHCADVKLVELNPSKRKLASLSGLLHGEALSLPYYRRRELQGWVDRTVAEAGIDVAFVFSSTMAQYVSGPRYARMRRIADFCDVDSDKWRQYAKDKRPPFRQVYAREANRLLAFERRIAAEFDATLFVSEAEADLFRTLAPESGPKISVIENGVDTGFFDPAERYASPYGPGSGPFVVFTGAMDYWPNVDAVAWFVETVFPLVRLECPTAEFWIVGSNPDAKVKALEERPGVRVTGRVADVRPYLANASVAVAPLRIARGTQNKVLEALAMARPLVCTPEAAAGLRLAGGPSFRVVEETVQYSRAVLELLDHGPNAEGRAAILAHYSWEANLRAMDGLFGESAGREMEAPA